MRLTTEETEGPLSLTRDRNRAKGLVADDDEKYIDKRQL